MADANRLEGVNPLSLFKRCSASKFKRLPKPTSKGIRDALKRGLKARARAEVSIQPGNTSPSQVFYK